MSLAVFRRTLLDSRRMLAGLAIGLTLFSVVVVSMFPSFRAQAALVERLMPSFLRMLVASVPMDKPEGYVSWASQDAPWLALALTWPIATAGAAIAGGIERGTLCWVMATPLSRTRYFLSRVAALVAGEALIIGAGTVTYGVLLYSLGLAPRGGVGGIALAGLENLLLYSAIGSVVLAVSAMASEAGKAYAVGLALTVGSLVAMLVAQTWSPGKDLKFLSLFTYYKPYDALRGLDLDPLSFAVPLGVSAVALAIGWAAFNRRDLPI